MPPARWGRRANQRREEPNLLIAATLRDQSTFYVRALDDFAFAKMAGIPQARFYGRRSTWIVPLLARNVEFLRAEFEEAEVDLDPTLAAEFDRVLARAAQAKTPAPDVAATYPFRTAPYAHQREAFNLLVHHRAFALFAEMGTGKTKVAIDATDHLFQTGEIEGHLVVAPPSALVTVWVRDYAKHSAWLPPDWPPTVLVGERRRRVRLLREEGPVWILNYEALASLEDELLDLLEERPVAVTLDESTNVKNPTAVRAKVAHALGERARRAYLLTGTPQTQDYLDLWSQFQVLDPEILGFSTFTAFRAYHAVYGGFHGREIVTWNHLEELKERVAAFSYRVLKDDCLDLPPKVHEVREVDLSKEQTAAYDQLVAEFAAELEDPVTGEEAVCSVSTTLTKLLRLHQVTAGFLATDEGDVVDFPSPKTDLLVDLAREVVAEGRKVVVQAVFRHEMDRLQAALEAGGLTAEQLNGSVPVKRRAEVIARFQDEPAPAVLVCQVQLAALGIDLTAASAVIRHTNTWSLQDTMQFEDRAHRLGQTRSVTYFDLLARSTIDETVQDALARKVELAANVVKLGPSALVTLLRGGKL